MMTNSTKNSAKNSVTGLLTTGLMSILSVMASVSLGNAARASDAPVAAEDQEQYFQIQSMTIEEVAETTSVDDLQSFIPSTVQGTSGPVAGGTIGDAGQIGNALMGLGTIINAGQLAWSIVEGNKPASNVSSETANAIPKDSKWESLVGWSAPQSRQFHVNYKNALGSTVIDFTYHVIYLFGGNVAGKGRFLNGVSVVPAELTVSWGYTFNAQAKVSSVTNAGTVKNPIAAMELQMQWTISSLAKSTTQTQSYYVRGDGQFQPLN